LQLKLQIVETLHNALLRLFGAIMRCSRRYSLLLVLEKIMGKEQKGNKESKKPKKDPSEKKDKKDPNRYN
jgi:hypothetical protein